MDRDFEPDAEPYPPDEVMVREHESQTVFVADVVEHPTERSHETSLRTEEPEAEPSVVTSLETLDPAVLKADGFTSSVPWTPQSTDCLVLTSSDPDFRHHTEELLARMGFQNPQLISIPSGPLLSLPLVATVTRFHKTFGALVGNAMERSGVTEIVCISTFDPDAYEVDSKSRLVRLATTRLRGGIREVQRNQLKEAAERLQRTFRKVTVRAFFVEAREDAVVHFEQVI